MIGANTDEQIGTLPPSFNDGICTPIHYHRQRRRDEVSVISGISLSPRRRRLGLYYQLYFDNIGQEEVCMFLRELLRHLRGQVIVVLDNSSTPKGAPLDQLLRQHGRLHIEHFPSSGYGFSEIVIRPHLKISSSKEREHALELLQEAEMLCLVSRTLGTALKFEPQIEVAGVGCPV
jgi:hypothetical protein